MQKVDIYSSTFQAYCSIERYIQQGWKVVTCTANDKSVLVVYEKEGE